MIKKFPLFTFIFFKIYLNIIFTRKVRSFFRFFFEKILKKKKFFMIRRFILKKKRLKLAPLLPNIIKINTRKFRVKNILFFKLKSFSWKTRYSLKRFALFRASKKELNIKWFNKRLPKLFKKSTNLIGNRKLSSFLGNKKIKHRLNSKSVHRVSKKVSKFSFSYFFFRKSYRSRLKNKTSRKRRRRPFFFKKFFFKSIKTNRFLLKNFFSKIDQKKKITRLVLSKSANNPKSILNSFEFSILNILTKSLFSYFYRDSTLFLQNSLIFVNGIEIRNPKKTLKIGDIIQVVLFKEFFMFLRNKYLLLNTYSNKIKGKVWRLRRNRFNFFKQRSKLIPKWSLRFIFHRYRIPKFLEVDFYSLTSIIIFKPKFIYNYNMYFYKFISLNFWKLYNWKILS